MSDSETRYAVFRLCFWGAAQPLAYPLAVPSTMDPRIYRDALLANGAAMLQAIIARRFAETEHAGRPCMVDANVIVDRADLEKWSGQPAPNPTERKRYLTDEWVELVLVGKATSSTDTLRRESRSTRKITAPTSPQWLLRGIPRRP